MHTYLQAISTVSCPSSKVTSIQTEGKSCYWGGINFQLSLKPINRYLDISKKALFLENIEFAVDKKVRLKWPWIYIAASK